MSIDLSKVTALSDQYGAWKQVADASGKVLWSAVKKPTAMLYSDGSFIFQLGDDVDASHGTLVASYTGFETATYSNYGEVPWYKDGNNKTVKSVSFTEEFSTVKPVSTANWFYYMRSLVSFDGTNLDTSNVTNMNYMFRDSRSITSMDVSGFDTSKVTDMRGMFMGIRSITSIDVSGFDTSKVTDTSGMFMNCAALTSLDLSNFDTSNVTRMDTMFNGCAALTSLDLSNFDTSIVTNMYAMFNGCAALTSLDLSNFDTSNVTDMDSMFMNCAALTSLDLSNFNTSSVIDMGNMFLSSSNLRTIYASDLWTVSKIPKYDRDNRMFYGCTSLVGAISYDSTKTSVDYANYQTGYLTYKAA